MTDSAPDALPSVPPTQKTVNSSSAAPPARRRLVNTIPVEQRVLIDLETAANLTSVSTRTMKREAVAQLCPQLGGRDLASAALAAQLEMHLAAAIAVQHTHRSAPVRPAPRAQPLAWPRHARCHRPRLSLRVWVLVGR